MSRAQLIKPRSTTILARQLTAGSTNPLTVLVTGCTSGIGKALVEEFARLGHNVIGCGRRLENLKTVEKNVNANNPTGKHFFYQCDVGKYESVCELKEKVNSTGLKVDILIANAGISIKGGRLYEIDVSEFERIIQINITSVFYTFKAFVSDMVKESNEPNAPLKKIIGISSGLAHSTSPAAGPYSTTKVGVEYMCKSMAQLFYFEGNKNIISVPLAPGVVTSEMMTDTARSIPTDKWSKTAVPFILNWDNSVNGSSQITPNAYSKEYQSTWIIPAGLPISTKVVSPSANDD